MNNFPGYKNFCLMLVIIFAGIPIPTFATTPIPSVSIAVTLEEMSGKLERGRFFYPIELVRQGTEQKVTVEAFLTPHQPTRFSIKKNTVFRKEINVRYEKQRNMRIPFDSKKPGLYELVVHISGRIDKENGYSDKILRYVHIGKKGEYRIISPKQFVREQRERRQQLFQEALKKSPDSPDIRLLYENAIQMPKQMIKRVRPHQIKNQLKARPVGPSDTIKKYVELKSDQAWSPEDPLTIQGRLTYLDYDGIWRPLANVSVNIYDEDVGFDDHLGTVSTNWSGDWSFSVNNDDGWLADGRDVYYTFKLENTRIRVQDCDGVDSTYKWKSEVHDDLSEGSVVNFGTDTGSTNINSMQIWNMLNLAWNHASTVGGRDPGFVDSCFPEGSGARWDRFWEEIDIPGSDNDAPDIVTHEYGHAVMWYAYGSNNPSPGGSHSFGDDNQNSSLAWSEGWATGFMLSLRPDGSYNWSEGDAGRNIENFSDDGNRDGNRNEGRVAAAINDMIDNADDDNGGSQNRGRDEVDDDNIPNRVALSSMLNDTLWGGYHTDFEDFWSSLSGELSGATLGDANEIMYYNYMDVPAPISCVATKVMALESKAPDDTLDGLRRFRDHLLKGFNGGQNLINTYYRNSPELALMLIKNSELRSEAVAVINHFSKIGYVLTNNNQMRKFANSRHPLVDKDMAKRIRKVMARIEGQASQKLKQDMGPLMDILASVEGLDIRALQQKLHDIKSKHPKTHKVPLIQSEFNAASKKSAKSGELEKIIKQYIPPFDRK